MDSANCAVANAAIDWFRLVSEMQETEEVQTIFGAVAAGRSLEAVTERSFIVDALEQVVEFVPDVVYQISKRIMDIYKSNLGNFATSAALESEGLLSIALALQRQDEPHRTHGLELFELLLHYNAYRAREVLMDIDRRPGAAVPMAQIGIRRRRLKRPK